MNKIEWLFIVWIGGVDNYYETYQEAKEEFDAWVEQGYGDVSLVIRRK